MELMTGEYFDCSISLKHLTGIQALGGVKFPEPRFSPLTVPTAEASMFTHSSGVFLCQSQQKGYQEANLHGLISVPPSWDCMGQYYTAGQSHLTSERLTLQMKSD